MRKQVSRKVIESLGWLYSTLKYGQVEEYYIDRGEVDGTKSKFVLSKNIAIGFISISIVENYTFMDKPNDEESFMIFQGKLNNRANLKTLMKWLGIN
jgi:hypothetical protein